jgi:hypothetical protein
MSRKLAIRTGSGHESRPNWFRPQSKASVAAINSYFAIVYRAKIGSATESRSRPSLFLAKGIDSLYLSCALPLSNGSRVGTARLMIKK